MASRPKLAEVAYAVTSCAKLQGVWACARHGTGGSIRVFLTAKLPKLALRAQQLQAPRRKKSFKNEFQPDWVFVLRIVATNEALPSARE